MTQNINNQLKLFKYEQYLIPSRQKIDEQYKQSIIAQSKNSFNPDLNPTIIQNAQNFNKNSPKDLTKDKILQQKYHIQPILTKNLLMRNYGSHKKFENIKLQKVSPKNVTIKFKQDLQYCIKKNDHRSSISKINKVLSHYKLLQIAENKLYLDYLSKLNKIDQNKQNDSKFQSLFNVKSIKISKKSPLQLDYKTQLSMNRINSITQNIKLKSKKSNQSSVQRDKENLINNDFNIKLSYRDLKKINDTELNKTFQVKVNHNYNQTGKRRKKQIKTENLYNKKLSFAEGKFLSTEQKLQRSSIYQKRSSNEISIKIPAMNQSDNNNLCNSVKLHDYNYQKQPMVVPNHRKDFIFEQKFIRYKSMLMKTAELHGIQLNFVQNYSRNQFNFYVGRGNNSVLVKEIFKKRWWLRLCEQKKNLQKNNILWTQLKQKDYYELEPAGNRQSECQNIQQKQRKSKNILHNHFQQNEFLGNKKALFYNMKFYYTSKAQNVFNYLPLTYHIISYNDDSWKEFIEEYQKSTELTESGSKCKNIWILKPGQNSNRGNGITVHSSLQSIQQIIKTQKSNRTYILQKYIQKPFLYNKRKFDIRCYMLLVRLNGKIKGYWYKQGYIRTSGYEFSLNDCENSFIHLTNDAVQVNCDNYGKYEDGNKLSYEAFQKYLDVNFNNTLQGNTNSGGNQKKYDIYRDIIPKLKNICLDSIVASYLRIGKWRQNVPTFELFGLDFMIDESFNPWLIEINTNPCLETSSRVLQKIIPNLLDNVFKLSVDIVFPPPLNWSKCTKHTISKSIDRNLFELVFDESEVQVQNKDKLAELTKDLEFDKIGTIDEDSEIYEEDQK